MKLMKVSETTRPDGKKIREARTIIAARYFADSLPSAFRELGIRTYDRTNELEKAVDVFRKKLCDIVVLDSALCGDTAEEARANIIPRLIDMRRHNCDGLIIGVGDQPTLDMMHYLDGYLVRDFSVDTAIMHVCSAWNNPAPVRFAAPHERFIRTGLDHGSMIIQSKRVDAQEIQKNSLRKLVKVQISKDNISLLRHLVGGKAIGMSDQEFLSKVDTMPTKKLREVQELLHYLLMDEAKQAA